MLNLASIVSQKIQKIDSHMLSLNINHKNGLVRADQEKKETRVEEKIMILVGSDN